MFRATHQINSKKLQTQTLMRCCHLKVLSDYYIMTTRNDLVSAFNKNIFTLLKLLEEKCPNANVDRVINLVKIAKRADHEVIITTIGPYVLKYHDLIDKKDALAFKIDNLESEINKSAKQADKYRTMIVDLFNIVYTQLGIMNEEQKDQVYGIASKLVDIYVDFCIKCKTENKK